MIIRAVLFDLDGTLIDSLEDLTDAVNHVRGAFFQPPLTSESVRSKVGKGVRDLVRRILPDALESEIESAVSLFRDFNSRHIADKSHLYPGILETLKELAARNIKMAVITNKSEDLGVQLLQALEINPLFEDICGGDTYPERKPSPLPLFKVAEKLGVLHHECVMVGDSINDIQAGQRANITTIGCTWGYGSTEEISGADFLAQTPQELLSLIPAGLR